MLNEPQWLAYTNTTHSKFLNVKQSIVHRFAYALVQDGKTIDACECLQSVV